MIATTKEQSDRLVELGVSSCNSDMLIFDNGELSTLTFDGYDEDYYYMDCHPVWSLSALFNLIPKIITINNGRYHLIIKYLDNNKICCGYYFNYPYAPIIEITSDNEFDVLISIIEWLILNNHKLNIKNEKDN